MVEVTESPVGLIQTVNADWPKSQPSLFKKPRNIEASGGDVPNDSPKQIAQRVGLHIWTKVRVRRTLIRFLTSTSQSLEPKLWTEFPTHMKV